MRVDAFIVCGLKDKNANLFNADLSNADLSGANLSNVDFSNALLEDIYWDENICWAEAGGLDWAINLPEALKPRLRK